MKLTPILLIPLLLFMTWCTIDWNDSFKEKEKCYSYKEKFEKDTGYIAWEIFFSKKMNTCIVRYHSNGVHFVHDILANKPIIDILDICVWSDQQKCTKEYDDFNKKVSELKWE